MKLQSLYKNQLINNLKLFNIVLGLSSIGNPSIQEFLEKSLISYQKICKSSENKKKTISTLMELCSDVMVLSEDCSFYNIGLVDFSAYERIDFLLDKVLKFSSINNVREFFKDDFIETVGYVMAIESNLGNNIKQSSSYIVIRNFLTLCHLGMYRFAYYYAVFIRCQIFISEGLSPRIEYSDLYKSELSLAIQKERSKFSKNLKKKISDSIRDTVNKVPLVNVDSKGDYVGSSLVVGEGKKVNGVSNNSVDSRVNSFVDNYRNADSISDYSKAVSPNNSHNEIELDLDEIDYSEKVVDSEEELITPKEEVGIDKSVSKESDVNSNVNSSSVNEDTNSKVINKPRKTSNSSTLNNLRNKFNKSAKNDNVNKGNDKFNEELNKSISSVEKLRSSKIVESEPNKEDVQTNNDDNKINNVRTNDSSIPSHNVDKDGPSVSHTNKDTSSDTINDSDSKQRSFTKARIRRVANKYTSNKSISSEPSNSTPSSENYGSDSKLSNTVDNVNTVNNVNTRNKNDDKTKDKDLDKSRSNLSEIGKSSFFS